MLGAAQLSMAPAGHVLGSAQIIVEYNGQRLVAAGDYKRSTDPTCQPFEIVPAMSSLLKLPLLCQSSGILYQVMK